MCKLFMQALVVYGHLRLPLLDGLPRAAFRDMALFGFGKRLVGLISFDTPQLAA